MRENSPSRDVVSGGKRGENSVPDDDLLAGLRRRDPAALTALMDAYLTPVHALCSRILAGAGSPQDVEECASDAFHAAWRQAQRFDPARAPLRTWLLMLAKYAALERRRQLIRQAKVEAPALIRDTIPAATPHPGDALAEAEERGRLQAALRLLPTLDRDLIYRRHFLGEPTTVLAAAYGLSRQAVDNRLWRARRQLRALLAADGAGQWEVHH